MLLGCIADDLTGATDVAGGLVRGGVPATIVVGVPREPPPDARGAVVVALKSRSIAAADAVSRSLESAEVLVAAGARRIYFKYASTFDSTPRGNIGQVTDALQDRLGARITVACPAYPANGRTVVDGVLLVDGRRLSESAMRLHPVNPMTESDVVRLLGAQTPRPVDLVDRSVVARGPVEIRRRLDELERDGVRHAVADAADDGELAAIAAAVADDPLVTGGSALAAAIGAHVSGRGERPWRTHAPPARGGDAGRWRGVVIAGSCSAATLRQVETFSTRYATRIVDPAMVLRDDRSADDIIEWASAHLQSGPVLVATSAQPTALTPGAGPAIESFLARLAARFVELGVRRVVVAGGETSGAVIEALGIRVLTVGTEIAPGVPVVTAAEPVELRLALKSGNFGSDRFFEEALAAMG